MGELTQTVVSKRSNNLENLVYFPIDIFSTFHYKQFSFVSVSTKQFNTGSKSRYLILTVWAFYLPLLYFTTLFIAKV